MVPLNPGESLHLRCNIVAWPPDVNFFWTFKRNGTVLPIPRTVNEFIAHHNNSQLGNMTNKIETSDDFESKRENKTKVTSKFPALLKPEGETEVNVTSEQEESVFPNTGLPHGGEVFRVKRKSVKTYETLHHQSVLTYKILSEQDYGTIACWARNSYGEQLRPCLFFISPRKIFLLSFGNCFNNFDTSFPLTTLFHAYMHTCCSPNIYISVYSNCLANFQK